ncbi:hypothetical protein VTL71DRAFT_36 [Oculimacula yallundae]|uniref:Uncharacterized protein n=1 Tax=Oculimacula yallundae TaxID=86028 RepID=A0ABR4D178_9HELO
MGAPTRVILKDVLLFRQQFRNKDVSYEEAMKKYPKGVNYLLDMGSAGILDAKIAVTEAKTVDNDNDITPEQKKLFSKNYPG